MMIVMIMNIFTVCKFLITSFNDRNNIKIHFFCFIDCASRYNYVIKTNLMNCLSPVYFVLKYLHVSGIFIAHQQDVYCVYIQQLVSVALFR